MTPEQFDARVRAAADADGRLPVPAQAGWEVFPFEQADLRVLPLEPLVLPEPPRNGEGDRWPAPSRDHRASRPRSRRLSPRPEGR